MTTLGTISQNPKHLLWWKSTLALLFNAPLSTCWKRGASHMFLGSLREAEQTITEETLVITWAWELSLRVRVSRSTLATSAPWNGQWKLWRCPPCRRRTRPSRECYRGAKRHAVIRLRIPATVYITKLWIIPPRLSVQRVHFSGIQSTQGQNCDNYRDGILLTSVAETVNLSNKSKIWTGTLSKQLPRNND